MSQSLAHRDHLSPLYLDHPCYSTCDSFTSFQVGSHFTSSLLLLPSGFGLTTAWLAMVNTSVPCPNDFSAGMSSQSLDLSVKVLEGGSIWLGPYVGKGRNRGTGAGKCKRVTQSATACHREGAVGGADSKHLY